MFKSRFIFNNLGVIFGVLAIFSLVAYADSWSAPTANPPGNNVAAPLNVSGSDQVKLGGLGVGPLAVFGDMLVSNVYKQGGVGNIKTGISLNCPGQTLGDLTVSGGIITGGACGAVSGNFGGLYSIDKSGINCTGGNYSGSANPLTGGYSCPAGFNDYSVCYHTSPGAGPSMELHFCSK